MIVDADWLDPALYGPMGHANVAVVGGRVLVEAWAACRPTATPHGLLFETTLEVGPVALGEAVLACFERYWPQVPRGHGKRVSARKLRRLGVRSWKGYLDLNPATVTVAIGRWDGGMVRVRASERDGNWLTAHSSVRPVEVGLWPVSAEQIGLGVRSLWEELGLVDTAVVGEGPVPVVLAESAPVDFDGVGAGGLVGVLSEVDGADSFEFLGAMLLGVRALADGEVGVVEAVAGVLADRCEGLVARADDLVARTGDVVAELDFDARVELGLDEPPVDRVGYVMPVEVAEMIAGHPVVDGWAEESAQCRDAAGVAAGVREMLLGLDPAAVVVWARELIEACGAGGVFVDGGVEKAALKLVSTKKLRSLAARFGCVDVPERFG